MLNGAGEEEISMILERNCNDRNADAARMMKLFIKDAI